MTEPKQNKYTAKPFLKWAGGKGQLIQVYNNYFPAELKSGRIKNYYEPFVGGGAVFFHLAQRFQFENVFLYDINPELILTYKVVQQNVSGLIKHLEILQNKYRNLNDEEQKDFYYHQREIFNKQKIINYNVFSDDWITRAAQIIFLNKTCYNGLFRFNRKGEFNTPAGRYKNPKILDTENLTAVSKLLKNVSIKNADFDKVVDDLLPGSFVYFDPPYRPLNATSQFIAYSKNEFNDEHQIKLQKVFYKLNKKGALQMLSNSDPKNTNPDDSFFDDLYDGFQINRVPAKRMINSNAQKRNALNELIITNYKPK